MGNRTLRAALMAALIAFVAVAGIGIFLGIDAGPSFVAGVVLGALSGLLILGAARRAESFHGTDGGVGEDPGDDGQAS